MSGVEVMSWLAAATAFVASWLWFRSANLRLPPPSTTWNTQPAAAEDFYQALLKSVRRNKWAPGFSRAAALFTAITLMLGRMGR